MVLNSKINRYGASEGGKKMINLEIMHAKESIENKLYINYYNSNLKLECSRIGSDSKCFCGHFYKNHKLNKKFINRCEKCICKNFKFIPQRPEECGMWWLPRRKDFDIKKWKAKCKCQHTHEDHSSNYPLQCKKCYKCYDFTSDFACISCDGKWDDHEILYETEMERVNLNKKIGNDYLPFFHNKEIFNLIENPKNIKFPNFNRKK